MHGALDACTGFDAVACRAAEVGDGLQAPEHCARVRALHRAIGSAGSASMHCCPLHVYCSCHTLALTLHRGRRRGLGHAQQHRQRPGHVEAAPGGHPARQGRDRVDRGKQSGPAERQAGMGRSAAGVGPGMRNAAARRSKGACSAPLHAGAQHWRLPSHNYARELRERWLPLPPPPPPPPSARAAAQHPQQQAGQPASQGARRAHLICCAVAQGAAALSSAAAPLTTGVAMLVPLSHAYAASPPLIVDRMFWPGAARWTARGA